MENYQPRVVKCSNLIVIILVFISTEADCKGVSVKNAGIMIPNVRQREIEAGATFDITCTFLHTSAIEWKLPDYLTIYKNVRPITFDDFIFLTIIVGPNDFS